MESAWLDGEIVVPNADGVPISSCSRTRSTRKSRIIYYLFDLPYLNGADLRLVLPVEQRRAALKVPNADGVPDFQLLQNAFDAAKPGIIYYLFDLPYLNGADLR